MTELRIGVPNEKQRRFLLDRHRHIAYGGARGGGEKLGGAYEGEAAGAAVRGNQAADRAQDTAGIAEQSH